MMKIQMGDFLETPCDGTWQVNAILDHADLKLHLLLELVHADNRSVLYPEAGELKDMTVRQLMYCLTNDYYKHVPANHVSSPLSVVYYSHEEDFVIQLGPPPVRQH
jgi:hypothetical protein